MKNLFTKMMLVAVAAMTFIGCSQEPTEINATVKKTTIELTANIDEVTRSYFGEEVTENGSTSYPSYWEGNESVKLVAYNSTNGIVAEANGTIEAEEGSATARVSATFEGELTDVVKLGAYVGGWSYMEPGVVELPEEQLMNTEGTVASNAHTLSAETAWDGTPATLELSFAHKVAYGKMTIKECPVAVEKIAKVEVALDDAVYTVRLGDQIATTDIWFACEEDTEFATLKVSVVADNSVTYSKSVDMSALAADKRLKFVTGEVSKFAISGLTKEAADHVVEFTEMTGPVSEDFGSWAGVGMKYTFSNAAGDTMQITFSEADGNPLKAGVYTYSSQCEDGCFYNNGTWIKLAGAEGETYIGTGEVTVALEDDVYTITYTGTIGSETYETTFTGSVAVWEYFNGHYYSDTNYGIFAKSVSGDEFFFDMYCDSSVGHVIPEGTYTYGWTNPRFVYSTVNGSSITDGTVTVAHLESGYQIDINVTTANGNFVYSFSGVVGIQNSGNDFRNPPIEYKDITVETEMATVLGSYEAGYPGYYGDSFDLDITTEQVDGVAYNLTLALALPLGETSNALIPAKTYTLGAADYTLTSESMGDGTKFTNATLTVAHDAAGYTLTFTGENVMKTKFILTYSGKIEKANEYNDFRNPGDATKLATPQNVNYTIEGTSAIITWDAVDNAVSYLVTYNETEETTDTNSFSFTTEPDTYYNVSVVAVPATGSTLYKNSDAGYASFTTPKDINATTDYNVTLTKITAIEGNTITFAGDDSNDRMKLYFNPGLASIEAGTYSVVYSYSSSSALEVMYNPCYNIAEAFSSSYEYYINPGDLVNVAKNGDEYTITVVSSTWINSVGATKSVKLVYTGALEVTSGGDVDEGIVFTSATATANGNWYDITFTDGTNTLTTSIGNGGVTYWDLGLWDSNNSYGSGRALGNSYYNDSFVALTATVSVVDEAYNIVLKWVGETATFNGQIDGFGLPGVIVDTVTVLEITSTSGVDYTSNYGEWETHFFATDGKEYMIDFYASSLPIANGTYTLTSGLNSDYCACATDHAAMTECTAVVTNNGSTSAKIDAEFTINGKKYELSATVNY